jgi:hypothetical protein
LTNQFDSQEFTDNNEPDKSLGSYLILSLFLLLLAFFILLNSISTRTEVKSRAVMDSLLSTFRVVDQSSRSAQTFLSRLGATPEPEELVSEMRRLWLTAIPVARVEVLTDGRTMQLRLPANTIFPGGEALLRKDRRQLMQNVATVLATESDGYSNEMELLIGTDWKAGDVFDLKANNLEIARAVEFADELIASGAPQDSVSIGIREGDGRELEFRFFVRSKAIARVEFPQFSE